MKLQTPCAQINNNLMKFMKWKRGSNTKKKTGCLPLPAIHKTATLYRIKLLIDFTDWFRKWLITNFQSLTWVKTSEY